MELSILRGWFSADAIMTVLSGAEAEDDLASLVAADTHTIGTRFRLLDTTRIYAAEKLAAGNGTDAAMARLATYLRERFERAEQELHSAAMADWSEDFSSQMANLRGALDWAFSPSGDPLLGVRMRTARSPLSCGRSFPRESRWRSFPTDIRWSAGC